MNKGKIRKIVKKTGTASVLHVDLKGFSTFSDVSTEEQVESIPSSLFSPGEAAADRNGGDYLKGMGDARYYSFGLGLREQTVIKTTRDAAIAAIRTGLEIQRGIERGRGELDQGIYQRVREVAREKEEGLNPDDVLRGRIGIATGGIKYTKRRVQRKNEEDINGKPMSLAHRLESNAPLGSVLVDKKTRELAGDRFEWKEIDVKLKGMGTVKAYVAEKERPTTFDVRRIKEGYYGRGEEISRIQRYVREGGSPILLTGEAGIGKTRTAEKATEKTPMLTVKFSVADRVDPFAGFRRLYRTVFGQKLDDEASLVEFLKKVGLEDHTDYVLLTEGKKRNNIPNDPDVVRVKKRQAFHAVRDRFAEWVIWDDVQWADAETLEALKTATQKQRNILTARPEFQPDFQTERMELKPLGEKESILILKEFLGEYFDKIDRDSLQKILDVTKGNPFHLKHRTLSLRERMEFGEDYRKALAEIPKEVKSLIESRILEYGVSIYRAFRVAAHLKRKWVYRRDLEIVSGEALDDETLKKMATAGLIDLSRPDTIEVLDEKVLEALYDSTPEGVRKTVHDAWGKYFKEMLSEKGQNPNRRKALLLLISDQYSNSKRPRKAVPYLAQLGKTERESGATGTAEEHLLAAKRILDKLHDDPNTRQKRLEVLRELGNTYRDMGLHVERKASQEERLRIVEELKTFAVENEYQAMIGVGASIMQTEPDVAIGLFERGRELAEQAQDEEFVLHAMNGLGESYLAKKDFSTSRQCYQRILERLPERSETIHHVNAYVGLGLGYRQEKNFEHAESAYQKAFEVADKLGVKTLMAKIKQNLAFLESQRHNKDGLLTYSIDALKYSKESGREEVQIAALANIAYVHLERGQTDQARPYLEEGEQLVARHQSLQNTTGAKYIREQIEHLKLGSSIAS